MATFNQFPAIGKGLINQAFLTPYTPFAIQILNPLDIRFTKTPVPGAKMHPEMPGNKYFSSFGQLWVIQSPPLTSELFPLRSSDHDCCWDTLLKTLHQSRQEINGKCKCKQTSNEYRQTPPNTQCCILLEIRPLLYILFPTKQKIYIHYQLVYLPNIDSSISTAKLSPPSMYLWHD